MGKRRKRETKEGRTNLDEINETTSSITLDKPDSDNESGNGSIYLNKEEIAALFGLDPAKCLGNYIGFTPNRAVGNTND